MVTAIIKQKDLLSGRWRNVEELDRSELSLHIRLVTFLRQRLRLDVLWYHTPNGEFRDKRSAAKLKAMGTLAGVADLEFKHCGQTLYLELKSPGEKPSPAQLLFARRAELAGAHYEWCDNFADAVSIVDRYGLLLPGGGNAKTDMD